MRAADIADQLTTVLVTEEEIRAKLDELAVHEPDARRLIAFLKAMEFSTLTRRVADYAQVDAGDVAADRRLELLLHYRHFLPLFTMSRPAMSPVGAW